VTAPVKSVVDPDTRIVSDIDPADLRAEYAGRRLDH
jgi:hypothetical protein